VLKVEFVTLSKILLYYSKLLEAVGMLFNL